MDKEITLKMPVKIAMLMVELLKRSDPYGLYLKNDLPLIASQLQLELEKIQKDGKHE